MKNALIIVCKSLKYNHIFIEYLKDEIKKDVGTLDSVSFVDEWDEDLFEYIEYKTKRYNNLFIAAQDGFLLISKILSTLTDDKLTPKFGMLLPSKVEEFANNSYKIKCNKNFINVLNIKELQTLPKILLRQKQPVGLFLFYEKKKQSERFDKLAKIFNVEFLQVELIEGLRHYLLSSKNSKNVERFLIEAQEIISSDILLGDDLSQAITEKLIEKRKTVTCAESCTGGLIAAEFVKNSGVSAVFKGSVVTYADEVKVQLTDVRDETLLKYGAVSYKCVDQMLSGVQKRFDTDFALAVSGVAGPDGGSEQKPVGTVYVGVKTGKKNSIIKKLSLNGNRKYIQHSSMLWALKLLVLSDKKFFFKKMPNPLDK